ILIIGNESHGLRPEFIPMLHLQVRIPDYAADASQKAESLNAAVATAIVCAEFRRRLRT
ncbi:MAG: RNA methyltransferase, partial [Bacteroidales bacterium]|nr:RNA methyltransferase [Bacteroidales bacterium]